VQEELEANLMHLIGLGEGECPANEASQTLAQGVVPALHVRQLATLLTYRFVSLFGNDSPIHLPKIAVTTSSVVTLRNPPPQPPTSSLATLAYDISNHLTSVSCQSKPHPAFVGFLSNEGPQLVELEHEFLGRRCGQQSSF
jgi:hypothetical protein